MTGSTAERSPSARRLPDRLWLPTLVGALLALGFVGALLVRADGDVSLLVHAAPPWTYAEDGTRGSLTVQPAADGFDGQFFYRLGVSPMSTDRTVDGVTFDLASLRNARWGYGALAFAASGGDPDLVPWTLVGLNLAAAAAVGAIGGGLARSSGRHAGWGLLFVLWPGFAYSLSLDTSELVASAFLLGGLLALRHRRWLLGGLLLTAAVLTRDTTAGVPFGVAVTGAWLWWSTRRGPSSVTLSGSVGGAPAVAHAAPSPVGVGPVLRRDEWVGRRPASMGGVPPSIDSEPGDPVQAGGRQPGSDVNLLVAGGLPLMAFAAWQLVQRSRFGSLPLTSSGDNNLSAPLTGLADQMGKLLPPSGGEEAFRLISVVGLVALVIAAAWCWRRSAATLAERVAWLPAVAVVVVLNAYLWSGATAFMRAATEVGLLSTLLILGSPRRRLLPLAGLGLAGLWALTAVAQLSKLS